MSPTHGPLRGLARTEGGMGTFNEHDHPRGTNGRWTRRASLPPATTLDDHRQLIGHQRPGTGALPVSQAAIDHHVDTHGQHLGPTDHVEVRCPGYDVYLPDTPARVTVRGGSVCRTPDRSRGRFEVRDGARLIARGGARVRVRAGSSVDVYDQASADLDSGAAGYLYGPDGEVRARAGSTVYAWAGTVHADAGARVWVMGPDVDLDAEDGALVGDGEDSPLSRESRRPLQDDVFERHRLNAETGAYDREPLCQGGRW